MMNHNVFIQLFRISLLTFLFFCFLLFCSAQSGDIQFQHLEAEEVLSDSRFVFRIEQDDNGFMWFGDVKYDGRNARRYTGFDSYALKMSKLLKENWGQEVDSLHYYDPKRDSFIINWPQRFNNTYLHCTNCFVKDTSRNIWIGTAEKGLFIYDPSNKSFQKENHHKKVASSLSSNRVSGVLRDSLDQIWISTWDAGLNLWLEKGKFRHFSSESNNSASLSSDTIYCLEQDKEGIIWIGTSQGLCRLDPITKIIEKITLPDFELKTLRRIFVHSSGKLWLGLDMLPERTVMDQIVIYDPSTEKVQDSFEDLNIYSGWNKNYNIFPIVEDHLGRVWLGSEGQGIFIYDDETERLAHFRRDPQDPNSLSSNKIRAIHRDRHNRIWIATFNGVNIYDPNAKLFHHFESDSEHEHFFNSENKWDGLEGPQGNIWIASRGAGLIKYDRTTNDIKVYKVEGPSPNETMRNDFIKIESDHQGNIWCATASGALYTLNRDTEKFTFIQAKVHGGLAKDSRGRIWAGGREGFFVYTDPKSQAVFYDWDTMSGTKLQMPHMPWPLEILEDCNGMIWVSGDFLLFRFNPVDQSVRQFLKNPEIGGFLALSLDRNCGLWMGSTIGQGLVYLSEAEQKNPAPKFKHWHKQNAAIPHQFIGNIVEDHEGKLWFGSPSGITHFDSNADTFLTYGKEQGFKTNSKTVVLGKDGIIYSAGMNGIGYFHPDRLVNNDYPPPLYLTDIQINGHSLVHNDNLPFTSPLQESITYAKSIQLKHWQNELTFEFIALNYTLQENNQYQYQLIGYDQELKTIDGSDPKAAYTNLSHGSYTFRLIGRNNDGYKSEEELTFAIYIAPPWWLSWWAYILYTFVAFGILWLIRRSELQRLTAKTEARQSRELASLKNRLYTNITHEFRTPITVILGMARQVRDDPQRWLQKGSEMIIRNGEQLLKLVNQMLDLSKLEEGHLPVQFIRGDLIRHLKYLTDTFKTYADTKGIRLHFLTKVEALQMDYDPEKVQTIVSNLVDNAIKFTPERGDVYLSIARVETVKDDDLLEISIKDNGMGIPTKQLPYIFDRFYQADATYPQEGESVRPLRDGGTGIGLALTRELVKLMGGSIAVSSQEKIGTEFTIQLPIRQEASVGTAEELAPPLPATLTHPSQTKGNCITDERIPTDERPLALLIEDNRDVLHYLKSFLAKQYDLDIASNGIEGIEKAIRLIPDIIISDVMMPGKDGFEVVNTLKEDERTGHIPIILLTAKADLVSRLQGLEQGADAYLPKPFDRKELEVRLRTLLKFRQKLQARYRQLDLTSSAENPTTTKTDGFIIRLRALVEQHIEDENFGILEICRELGSSRSQLHRKLKALTGKSTSKVIRTIRLQKAKKLLESSNMNVSEVGYSVGFMNRSHFITSFKEEFAVPPGVYKKNYQRP